MYPLPSGSVTQPPQRQYGLHVHIMGLFLSMLLVFSAVLITKQYLDMQQMIFASADDLLNVTEKQVRGEIGNAYTVAKTGLGIIAETPFLLKGSEQNRLQHLPQLTSFLESRSDLTSVYIGYASGDFFAVKKIHPWERISHTHAYPELPAQTVYLVASVKTSAKGTRHGTYYFYSYNLQILGQSEVANDDKNLFDPRKRPWYKLGMQYSSGSASATPLYPYFAIGKLGTTIIHKTEDGNAIIAVDVTQDNINNLLGQLRPTPKSELFLLNKNGEVFASTDTNFLNQDTPPVLPKAAIAQNKKNAQAPLFKSLLEHIPADKKIFQPVKVNGMKWLRTSSHLNIPNTNISLVIATPSDEFLAGTRRIRDQGLWVTLIAVLLAIPVTFWLAHLASRPLKILSEELAKIRALKFNAPITVSSPISEVQNLASSISMMKLVFSRIQKMGISLAKERDFDKLQRVILKETMRATFSQYGFLYLQEPDGTLKPSAARSRDNKHLDLPPALNPALDTHHPAIEALRNGDALLRKKSVHLSSLFPNFNMEEASAFIAIPLTDRQKQNVGVLLLVQTRKAFPEATERDILTMVKSISSAAVIAINTQQLVQEQKKMMESLIHIIAGAIDAKNPYTANHCQRVPDLTKLLAQAATHATEGVFKDFQLSPDQWEELHIASWLHDCGKVTTPEHVIDKATKLETIYNRIHEIRMRFELIKREAEVLAWRAIHEGADPESTLAALQQNWDQLDEEFAFVAHCNQGFETTTLEDKTRLHNIAQRTWTRTLNDRLGTSLGEQMRQASAPQSPLPKQEFLLADKPEHLIERKDQDLILPNNPWGFNINVPKHLYNFGELYNLTILQGTLTPEERYKINEHIVETIRMLSRLPLPQHLRHVVDIAGGHHERMDGNGYPRRIKMGDALVQTRIIAIADVFEALTSQDRPYKKSKTLSEALGIMTKMCRNGHLDPSLFNLFLTSGVYFDYAKNHLKPHQIDAVDIQAFLS